MKGKRYIAVILMLFFCSMYTGLVRADELDDKQQELQNVQQQMESQQGKVNQAQEKVDSLANKLHAIQIILDAAAAEYKKIQNELSYTEQQIKLNEELLAKTEKSLAERTVVLNKRVRDIYKNGQISYLDILFGAADFNDFATRMDIWKRVVRQDVELIMQIRTERQLVVQKKEELEQDRAKILVLQQQAAEKKNIIETQKKEQQNLLNAAVNDRDAAEREYKDLMDTSRQIERMIRKIQAGTGGGGGSTGTMIWPYSGPITSPFGWRTHPIFGTSIFHSGLDIGADYGDPVVAADGGVVIYAEWMGGYGNAVIIDHGRGISTLYGHNSQLVVSEGQSVRQGQTIAYAGSTGYSTGPHVHFEVRENGSPVSPLSYLQ